MRLRYFKDYLNNRNFGADRSFFWSFRGIVYGKFAMYIFGIAQYTRRRSVILRWVGKDKVRGHARKTRGKSLRCRKESDGLNLSVQLYPTFPRLSRFTFISFFDVNRVSTFRCTTFCAQLRDRIETNKFAVKFRRNASVMLSPVLFKRHYNAQRGIRSEIYSSSFLWRNRFHPSSTIMIRHDALLAIH